MSTQGAGEHFGPGDDGTPRFIGQPVEKVPLVLAIVFGVIALGMIVGGFLLLPSSRRARRAGPVPLAAGPAPTPGPPRRQ